MGDARTLLWPVSIPLLKHWFGVHRGCDNGHMASASKTSSERRLALNVLKRGTTAKLGLKGKRLKAGGDNDYLLRVLAAA